jgi:ribosomal protein L3
MSEKNVKSISHNLKFPVSVSVDGDIIEAQSVEIFAPNNKVYKEVNIIDVEFNKSRSNAIQKSMDMVKDMSESKIEQLKKMQSSEKEKTPEPSEIISEMIQNGADMNKCFDALKEILTKQTTKASCLIDTVPMKKEHFDELSVIDTKEILGKYIINFLGISRSI